MEVQYIREKLVLFYHFTKDELNTQWINITEGLYFTSVTVYNFSKTICVNGLQNVMDESRISFVFIVLFF